MPVSVDVDAARERGEPANCLGGERRCLRSNGQAAAGLVRRAGE